MVLSGKGCFVSGSMIVDENLPSLSALVGTIPVRGRNCRTLSIWYEKKNQALSFP
jgi:hypothetical protein